MAKWRETVLKSKVNDHELCESTSTACLYSLSSLLDCQEWFRFQDWNGLSGAHHRQRIGSRWEEAEKGKRDGDRQRADVHLSCIIVLNASTAVLVLETM